MEIEKISNLIILKHEHIHHTIRNSNYSPNHFRRNEMDGKRVKTFKEYLIKHLIY